MQASSTTTYTEALGYGFQESSPSAADRGTGDALERDLVYARDMSFAVDVPSGLYRVKLTTGDMGGYTHDQMGVYLEGTLTGMLDVSDREMIETVYENIEVNDGQLNLQMTDLGGADAYAVLNGLHVEWVEAAPAEFEAASLKPLGDLPSRSRAFALMLDPTADADGFIPHDLTAEPASE